MSNMFNKKEPNKNVNKISTLAYGEYSTINLSPGFYEIQYKVSRTGYSIIMEPKSMVLEVEEGKTYYIFTKWDCFYNRYSGQIHHLLFLVHSKNEKMGMFHLSRNFKKSKR